MCVCLLSYYFYYYFRFIDIRERGRERKRGRNIAVREKHQLVASHTCPDGGSNLHPRYVP